MERKSKRLREGSPEWATAWSTLISNGIAIRSSLRFNSESSAFNAELIFSDEEDVIYRLKCERMLGTSIRLPVTKLERLDSSLETFLLDMRYAWPTDADKNRHIVNRCLDPVPHVATVI